MDFLERITAWANANEGVLQAIAMLAMAGGVLLSPLGGWARRRLPGETDSHPGQPLAAPPVTSAEPDRASIAVMPFDAPSADPEHEYLADGLCEDLVTLLARFPGFFVIARQSTLAYRERAADVREIGRELGVRYVLQGSVRKVGDRLRLSAQLVETAGGTNVWTGRFERPAEELGRIQDELTGAVVSQLEPELVRAEAELARRRPPSDWDAWSYYKRAQARLNLGGWHEDTFEEATDLLRRAIELDSDFALARAQLALLLAFGHRVGFHIDRDAARREALAEAEQAIVLEGHRSEVGGFAGCAFADLGRADRGIPILERAVETNPSNAQAWAALGAARLSVGQVFRRRLLRPGLGRARPAPSDGRRQLIAPRPRSVSCRRGRRGGQRGGTPWASQSATASTPTPSRRATPTTTGLGSRPTSPRTPPTTPARAPMPWRAAATR